MQGLLTRGSPPTRLRSDAPVLARPRCSWQARECRVPTAAAVSAKARPHRQSAPGPRQGQVLLVGATGRTGRAALWGLLQESGLPPGRLTVLTRQPNTPEAHKLGQLKVRVVEGDLDDVDSLEEALRGVRGVYIHALTRDAAVADPKEVRRARRLAAEMRQAGVQHVVFCGAAGRRSGLCSLQMQQKQVVEDLLAGELPLTSLQAPLFMEEFWRGRYRAGILQGKLAFPLPPDRPMQLLAAKDLGRVAAQALASPRDFAGQCLPLAGDELTPLQLCEAFWRAQARPVAYLQAPAWPLWLFDRELYSTCRLLEVQGFGADVEDCRRRFGMTSFANFLEESHWAGTSAAHLD